MSLFPSSSHPPPHLPSQPPATVSFPTLLTHSLGTTSAASLHDLDDLIRRVGYEWMEGYMEGVMERVGGLKAGKKGGDGLHKLLKTPRRAKNPHQSTATTTATTAKPSQQPSAFTARLAPAPVVTRTGNMIKTNAVNPDTENQDPRAVQPVALAAAPTPVKDAANANATGKPSAPTTPQTIKKRPPPHHQQSPRGVLSPVRQARAPGGVGSPRGVAGVDGGAAMREKEREREREQQRLRELEREKEREREREQARQKEIERARELERERERAREEEREKEREREREREKERERERERLKLLEMEIERLRRERQLREEEVETEERRRDAEREREREEREKEETMRRKMEGLKLLHAASTAPVDKDDDVDSPMNGPPPTSENDRDLLVPLRSSSPSPSLVPLKHTQSTNSLSAASLVAGSRESESSTTTTASASGLITPLSIPLPIPIPIPTAAPVGFAALPTRDPLRGRSTGPLSHPSAHRPRPTEAAQVQPQPALQQQHQQGHQKGAGGVRSSWLSKVVGGEGGVEGLRKSMAGLGGRGVEVEEEEEDEEEEEGERAERSGQSQRTMTAQPKSTEPPASQSLMQAPVQPQIPLAQPTTTATTMSKPRPTNGQQSHLRQLMADLQERKAMAASQGRMTVGGGAAPVPAVVVPSTTPGVIVIGKKEREEAKKVETARSEDEDDEEEEEAEEEQYGWNPFRSTLGREKREEAAAAAAAVAAESAKKESVRSEKVNAVKEQEQEKVHVQEVMKKMERVSLEEKVSESRKPEEAPKPSPIQPIALAAQQARKEEFELFKSPIKAVREQQEPESEIEESTTPQNSPPSKNRLSFFAPMSYVPPPVVARVVVQEKKDREISPLTDKVMEARGQDKERERERPVPAPQAVRQQQAIEKDVEPALGPKPTIFAIKPPAPTRSAMSPIKPTVTLATTSTAKYNPAFEPILKPKGLSASQAFTLDGEEDDFDDSMRAEDLADLLEDVTRTTNGGELEIEPEVMGGHRSEATSGSETNGGSRPGSRQARPGFKPTGSSASGLNASTNSRSGSQDRFGQASLIANKTLGVKPNVDPPKSVLSNAQIRAQQRANEVKRNQIKELRELKARQKQEEKEKEERVAAEAERQKRIREAERRKREVAEAEKKRKEREEQRLMEATKKVETKEPSKDKVLAVAMAPVKSKADMDAVRAQRPVPPPPGGDKRPLGMPVKGKEIVRPKAPVPAAASGAPTRPTGPVRPAPSHGPPGQPNPFQSASSTATQLTLSTMIKPTQARSSMLQSTMQKAALAQSMRQSINQNSRMVVKDELTALQRRIAAGGSASPQVRPEDIELPDIDSDFGYDSDSGDDRRRNTKKSIADWVSSPELRQGAARQENINPEDLFGKIPEVVMDELFPEARKGKFRPRSSSANWGGTDRLTKQEEIEYAMKMGYKTMM